MRFSIFPILMIFHVMKSLEVGDFGAEIKDYFFTDWLDTCHFIFVSVCAEYADNNILTLIYHKKVVSDCFEVHFYHFYIYISLLICFS